MKPAMSGIPSGSARGGLSVMLKVMLTAVWLVSVPGATTWHRNEPGSSLNR
eukprot:CAMPEP_0182943170 /NCGR_PEP_ID=MMETSP0105_2-20130417/51936_1 /TAXON_ID=81532 ORGANISM="Acanthoeca-like sp., Strain 10tr" /NCGR_SAMPLE_ID=MMETSP0105_2 /ASSEMBLY_ACC=CAM_ASM_000205 /LENGTH=50 /DNA_ID=CAMNT_0025082987 /DNA_START=12 /DNA_END=160 /DNA_ORIENTATION=-